MGGVSLRQKSADVVVAGHICLDVIPAIGERKGGMGDILEPGKLIDIGPAVVATGGAVSNTGIALHRLGTAVRLMGKVGDDWFGRAILDVLRGYGEELVDGMLVTPGENSSYTIVISPPGVDRIFLHCTGTNDTFTADDLNYGEVAGARLFHFGYPPLMRRMFSDGGKEAADMFAKVKSLGVTTSLDMARPDPKSAAGRADWRAVLRRLLPYVDVFLPSFEEIMFMLDRAQYERLQAEVGSGDLLVAADGELLRSLADELIGMGASVVALKLGEHGLYVRTTADTERLIGMGACAPADPGSWADRELLAPCFQVEVAGTTGAGDCTIAGFLTGLLQGMMPERVLTGAVAVGACNVEKADATSGLHSWDEVQRRISAGWPRHPVKLALPGWHWDDQENIWRGPNDRGGNPHARKK
jgi:sugar/nucleoside kinase (ribokinase family)